MCKQSMFLTSNIRVYHYVDNIAYYIAILIDKPKPVGIINKHNQKNRTEHCSKQTTTESRYAKLQISAFPKHVCRDVQYCKARWIKVPEPANVTFAWVTFNNNYII
jgi:hypothetical protein